MMYMQRFVCFVCSFVRDVTNVFILQAYGLTGLDEKALEVPWIGETTNNGVKFEARITGTKYKEGSI